MDTFRPSGTIYESSCLFISLSSGSNKNRAKRRSVNLSLGYGSRDIQNKAKELLLWFEYDTKITDE